MWFLIQDGNIAIAVCLLLLLLFVILGICRVTAFLFTNQSHKTGRINKQQACKIYERKLTFMQTISSLPNQAKAIQIKKEQDVLARRYGIRAKAIEDIWNRKTWVMATAHLWTNE